MPKRERELPSIPEMAGALSAEKNKSGYNSKIYKVQADEHRGEQLAADLDRKIKTLKQAGTLNRVEWDDLPYIKERCLAYLEACRNVQTLPTVAGLSVFGLGATRQALNAYLRQHPTTPTAVFLQQMKDLFSDTLETAALTRSIDTVMAIFVMKNDHDRSDRVQLEAVQTENPMGEDVDAAALKSRILNSIPAEDYDEMEDY